MSVTRSFILHLHFAFGTVKSAAGMAAKSTAFFVHISSVSPYYSKKFKNVFLLLFQCPDALVSASVECSYAFLGEFACLFLCHESVNDAKMILPDKRRRVMPRSLKKNGLNNIKKY